MSDEVQASMIFFNEQELSIATKQQIGKESRQERQSIKIRRLSTELKEKQNDEAVVGSDAGSDLRHRLELEEERYEKNAILKLLVEELYGSESEFLTPPTFDFSLSTPWIQMGLSTDSFAVS